MYGHSLLIGKQIVAYTSLNVIVFIVFIVVIVVIVFINLLEGKQNPV